VSWTLIRFLHLLGMAFFVGGQPVLVGVLLGRHAVAPRSRALALTVLLVPLAIVWLGVDLAH
jgi:hypothetical protein